LVEATGCRIEETWGEEERRWMVWHHGGFDCYRVYKPLVVFIWDGALLLIAQLLAKIKKLDSRRK
jgi:cytochrome c biogenesis factor